MNSNVSMTILEMVVLALDNVGHHENVTDFK
jgi:hypothetical protein